MKTAILGILIMVAGIIAGLWVGVWWGIIGGIIAIVEALKVDPIPAIDLALGIARVLFAGTLGSLVACAGFVIGGGLMHVAKD